MKKQSMEVFKDTENGLYAIIMINTYHYTWVQTQRMRGTTSEPQDKLWVLGDEVPMQVHCW